MHKHKTIVPQNKENKNIFVDSTKKSSKPEFRISSLFAKDEPRRRDEAQKYRLNDSWSTLRKNRKQKNGGGDQRKKFAKLIPDCTAAKKCAGDF